MTVLAEARDQPWSLGHCSWRALARAAPRGLRLLDQVAAEAARQGQGYQLPFASYARCVLELGASASPVRLDNHTSAGMCRRCQPPVAAGWEESGLPGAGKVSAACLIRRTAAGRLHAACCIRPMPRGRAVAGGWRSALVT
jgi:hypothetical protein